MRIWKDNMIYALNSAEKWLQTVTADLIHTQDRELRVLRSTIVSAIHHIRNAQELLQEEGGEDE